MDLWDTFWAVITKPPYTVLLYIALVIFASGIILSVIGNLLHPGSRHAAHHVSSCMAILFAYLVAIFLQGESAHLSIFSAALPFCGPAADFFSAATGIAIDWRLFGIEIAKMFFLALLVNLLQALLEFLQITLPHINNFIAWYLAQCILVTISLVFCYWYTDILTLHWNPVLRTWLPIGIMIVVSVLAIVRIPIFSESPVGQAMRQTFYTTLVVAVIVILGRYLGWFTQMRIEAAAVAVFGPVLFLLIVIWYLAWAFFPL